jgi:hypothetical protein
VLGPGSLGQTVEQAQVLTYVELFLMLSAIFTMSIALLPFMRRVRTDPAPRVEPAIKPLPAPVD